MVNKNSNPPIPQNKKERLQALQSYNLPDTLLEPQFDRLTRLEASICGIRMEYNYGRSWIQIARKKK